MYKTLIFSILLNIGLLSTVQAVATFNPKTGEMLLPSVIFDTQTTVNITLKRTMTDTPLSVGDTFTIAKTLPNVPREEKNNVIYSTITNMAYIPLVADGERMYRVILQISLKLKRCTIAMLEEIDPNSSLTDAYLSRQYNFAGTQLSQAEKATVCSTAFLQGTYHYTANNAKLQQIGLIYFNGVAAKRFISYRVNEDNDLNYAIQEGDSGTLFFDGKGNVIKTNLDFPTMQTHTLKGQYTVNANCEATMTYPSKKYYQLFLVGNGNIVFLQKTGHNN